MKNTLKLNALAKQAYIYFYPLVSMEMTRLQFLYADPNVTNGASPMNHIEHFRKFPTADSKTVVRVNFDTLYSTGWVDLMDGPVILSVGDNKQNRYFELPLYDMWTDAFAIPGSRSSGFEAKDWIIVPQGWQGNIPENIEVINAPTKYVWLIGRTQANGSNDKSIHKFQDTIKLTPLKFWNTKSEGVLKKTEPRSDVDTTSPVTFIVNNMDVATYYDIAMESLINNPVHYTDWSLMSQLKQIGIEAGKKYTDLDSEVQNALKTGMKEGLSALYEASSTTAKVVNGWKINNEVMGVYGNEYLKRATIALVGLGANPPEEAIYPFAQTDNDGEVLIGEKKYVIHFEKELFPPVDAFWSLTMYDNDGYQVANSIDRFAIGDRNDLTYNANDSLDIYIQKDRPSDDKVSNWLPSPTAGELGLTMRLYNPKEQILNLEWVPPVIKKVKFQRNRSL